MFLENPYAVCVASAKLSGRGFWNGLSFALVLFPKMMTKSTSMRIPVVIVGGSLNSLGVARSLSIQKMPIYVLETSRRCPTAWSRYCRWVQVESIDGHSLVHDLKKLAMRMRKRPILILTDDRAVDAVSTYRAELEPWYRISLPSNEMVRTLADKTLFHRFAEQHQLPIPRSAILDRESDLCVPLGELRYPVVIKPANKAYALNGAVERAIRADSSNDAYRIATQMLTRADQLIAQEWIKGPDTELFFTLFACDSQSRIVALFTGRKIVCDPPKVGNTAVCVPAFEEATPLEEITRELVALTKYKGLGSLEFKRDQRNGKFLMVEPTVGRTDWQEEIATLSGVNLPMIHYRTQLYASYDEFNRPSSRPVAWRSSRLHRIPTQWFRDGMRVTDGYFRFWDPLPALYFYAWEYFLVRAWRQWVRGVKWFGSKPSFGIEWEKKA